MTLKLSAQLTMLDASIESAKTGERITGLTLEDFRVTEDGVAQKLTYLSEDRLPLSIVLMFDVTDSEQPILHALASGAAEVVRHLRPEDEVSVMVFSSTARLLQDFTQDREALERAIQKAATIHDRGTPTFIQEDVYEGALQAERATVPNSRRVIVFLTDGTTRSENFEDNYFRARPQKGIAEPAHHEDALAELRRARATVSGLIDHSWMTYMIGGGWTQNNHMGAIAAFGPETGGTFLPTPRKEVAQHLARLIDTMRQRYTIGYKPSVVHDAGTVCHVKVTLSPQFFARHISLSPETVAIRSPESYTR